MIGLLLLWCSSIKMIHLKILHRIVDYLGIQEFWVHFGKHSCVRSFLWNNVFCVIRVTENSYHRILEEIKVLNTILPGLRFLKSWDLWATTAARSFETLIFSIFSSASSSLNFFNFSMESLTLTNTLFGEVVTKDIKIWMLGKLPASPFARLGISKTMVLQSITYKIGMCKRKIPRGVDVFMLQM